MLLRVFFKIVKPHKISLYHDCILNLVLRNHSSIVTFSSLWHWSYFLVGSLLLNIQPYRTLQVLWFCNKISLRLEWYFSIADHSEAFIHFIQPTWILWLTSVYLPVNLSTNMFGKFMLVFIWTRFWVSNNGLSISKKKLLSHWIKFKPWFANCCPNMLLSFWDSWPLTKTWFSRF